MELFLVQQRWVKYSFHRWITQKQNTFVLSRSRIAEDKK